jgi:hypothetical protein
VCVCVCVCVLCVCVCARAHRQRPLGLRIAIINTVMLSFFQAHTHTPFASSTHLRYVYTAPTPGCRELLAVVNTSSKRVCFTTDRSEFPVGSDGKARSRSGSSGGGSGGSSSGGGSGSGGTGGGSGGGGAGAPSYRLCGVECYLMVHHGALRVRPAPAANSVDGLQREWNWSKEIAHFHRNVGAPERNLLCLSALTRSYCHVFDCGIRTRPHSVEWTLDSSLYVENTMPHEVPTLTHSLVSTMPHEVPTLTHSLVLHAQCTTALRHRRIEASPSLHALLTRVSRSGYCYLTRVSHPLRSLT